MKREDCVFCNEKKYNTCNALKKMYCVEQENCKFYKNKEDYHSDGSPKTKENGE